jgi:hypothetical protein
MILKTKELDGEDDEDDDDDDHQVKPDPLQVIHEILRKIWP